MSDHAALILVALRTTANMLRANFDCISMRSALKHTLFQASQSAHAGRDVVHNERPE